MRKIKLPFILSLFILLALPVISLYYSFQGAKLRKQSLQELTVKSILPSSISTQLTSNFRYRLLQTNCSDTADLHALINQFINEKIEFVFVNNQKFNNSFSPSLMNKWNASGSLISISDSTFNLPDCRILLADSSHQVLNTYDFNNSNERTKLVENLAFLITKK